MNEIHPTELTKSTKCPVCVKIQYQYINITRVLYIHLVYTKLKQFIITSANM